MYTPSTGNWTTSDESALTNVTAVYSSWDGKLRNNGGIFGPDYNYGNILYSYDANAIGDIYVALKADNTVVIWEI